MRLRVRKTHPVMTIISTKNKMKNIAIIYGSDSSEWEVSIRSGEFTASQFDREQFNVYEVFARFGKWVLAAYREGTNPRVSIPEQLRPDIDKTDFSVNGFRWGSKLTFDFVYIMQHGTPGENGLMQGYFEMLGIPFSSCSSFVSATTFDKFSCKSYLRDVPYVKCAKDIFLRKGQEVDPEQWVAKLGLPMFVKPTDGGSSFGVTKVKRMEDIVPAVEAAFAEGRTVIAEEAVTGREITCAVYTDEAGRSAALPIIEIVPHTEWFDYEAKYNGLSDEICPAQLDSETWEKVQDTSRKIYGQLGCEGLVRIDYILSDKDLYFLEMNTIPGMTSASLVPKMVKAAGMSMTDFLTAVIKSKYRF